MYESEKILEKLDQLNINLEVQKNDKSRINDISDKIDDIQVTLQVLVTTIEYETIISQKNKDDIEKLNKRVDDVEKAIVEITTNMTFMKKINFVLISSSVGIITSVTIYLIKGFM